MTHPYLGAEAPPDAPDWTDEDVGDYKKFAEILAARRALERLLAETVFNNSKLTVERDTVQQLRDVLDSCGYPVDEAGVVAKIDESHADE
jgi:hypothetical protein